MDRLQVYNSLSNKLEEFQPLQDKTVRMYVCGPTVYDHGHIGHARFSIVFDMIRRVLEYLGYNVLFVSNYTDIDDKMIERANKRGISIHELADEIIASYEEDMRALNVREPTVRPYATAHMENMISLVETLIKKGFAYVNDSGVYFRVTKFQSYGILSNRDIKDAQSQSDESVELMKENPADFALMKKSKEGEPFWDTPWGKMRPGWHIECSAMSMRYLGESFDIHGGGQDLLFPHHENELAQSEAATGKKFVKYWLHNGFLTKKKEKMSKSLGNFFTIKEILKQGYSGLDIRFFMLTGHYRKPLEFDEEAIAKAKLQMQKIRETLDMLKQLVDQNGSQPSTPASTKLIETSIEQLDLFRRALLNDFNTPDALTSIYRMIKEINSYVRKGEDIKGSSLKGVQEIFITMLDVLGINPIVGEADDKEVGDLLTLIIDVRSKLRKEKNWALSDFIRDELKKLGYILEDDKGKTVWKKQ